MMHGKNLEQCLAICYILHNKGNYSKMEKKIKPLKIENRTENKLTASQVDGTGI